MVAKKARVVGVPLSSPPYVLRAVQRGSRGYGIDKNIIHSEGGSFLLLCMQLIRGKGMCRRITWRQSVSGCPK